MRKNTYMAIAKENKLALLAPIQEQVSGLSETQLLENSRTGIQEQGYDILDLDELPDSYEACKKYYENRGYCFTVEYVEMSMDLEKFTMPEMEVPEDVSFGIYQGTLEELQRAVAQVEEKWVDYFSLEDTFFCCFRDGEVVAFCILNQDAKCILSEGENKIGSIGCVGTLPQHRKQGIGLKMVALATKALKEAGCDKAYLHYVYLKQWYGRLGYESFFRFALGEKEV